MFLCVIEFFFSFSLPFRLPFYQLFHVYFFTMFHIFFSISSFLMEQAFDANQSLLSNSNHIETKIQRENRKIQHNDDSIATNRKKQRFQQIQLNRQHQKQLHQRNNDEDDDNDNNMLNTIQRKQHEVIVSEWKSHLQQLEHHHHRNIHRKQKQQQIIPEENVIIGIFRKLFHKRFFPSPLSLSSSLQSEAAVTFSASELSPSLVCGNETHLQLV